MGFTEQDVATARQFGEMVVQHAKWELSTKDALQLMRHMTWYNTLVKRLEDHVCELRAVVPAPASTPAPKGGRKAAK